MQIQQYVKPFQQYARSWILCHAIPRSLLQNQLHVFTADCRRCACPLPRGPFPGQDPLPCGPRVRPQDAEGACRVGWAGAVGSSNHGWRTRTQAAAARGAPPKRNRRGVQIFWPPRPPPETTRFGNRAMRDGSDLTPWRACRITAPAKAQPLDLGSRSVLPKVHSPAPLPVSVNKQILGRTNNCGNASFQSAKSGAGLQFLLLDCRERACATKCFFSQTRCLRHQ